MVLTSSNDAAEALADFYGRKEFIDKMNVKALELGMKDTEFFDPSGLSDLNQSTAFDIKKLAVYLIERYWNIFSVTVRPRLAVGGKSLQNINQFSGKEGFLGGKTGYLETAKRNLVSLFRINGKRILFIVLGSPDHYADTEILTKWLSSK